MSSAHRYRFDVSGFVLEADVVDIYRYSWTGFLL